MTREEFEKKYIPIMVGRVSEFLHDLDSLFLPPAEGAKIRGDADAILSRFKDNVRGSVVTCYKIVFYEDAIQAMYEFAALQQPTAEGAEEMLYKGLRNGKYEDITCNPDIEIKAPFYQAIIRYAEDFAALHAKKIADKMVEDMRQKLFSMRATKESMDKLNEADRLMMYGYHDCINEMLMWTKSKQV